jgi:hypothetical protein
LKRTGTGETCAYLRHAELRARHGNAFQPVTPGEPHRHLQNKPCFARARVVEGKCATTLAELNRGEQVAAGILRAVGLKEQGTALVAATSDIRTRALTLLLRVYDSARRAIGYLRWNENDADTIAPSLYAGRGTGKKETSSDVTQPPKPTPPAAATPSTPGAGTTGAQNTPEHDAQAAAPKPAASRTDPFLA